MAHSPLKIPLQRPSEPKGPIRPRGLLGALASSSKGLKIAIFLLDMFEIM